MFSLSNKGEKSGERLLIDSSLVRGAHKVPTMGQLRQVCDSCFGAERPQRIRTSSLDFKIGYSS